jgi:signal transduction histidine kinase
VYRLVRVTDTGIGIPEEMRSVVFEKFRQLDSSDTRLYEGVGLGLYIVKQFTELLGGAVDVVSTPGEGSVFTVTLPC